MVSPQPLCFGEMRRQFGITVSDLLLWKRKQAAGVLPLIFSRGISSTVFDKIFTVCIYILSIRPAGYSIPFHGFVVTSSIIEIVFVVD